MNDGDTPVLVFEQNGDTREIIHDRSYHLLLKESRR